MLSRPPLSQSLFFQIKYFGFNEKVGLLSFDQDTGAQKPYSKALQVLQSFCSATSGLGSFFEDAWPHSFTTYYLSSCGGRPLKHLMHLFLHQSTSGLNYILTFPIQTHEADCSSCNYQIDFLSLLQQTKDVGFSSFYIGNWPKFSAM